MNLTRTQALKVSDAIISCQLDGKGGSVPLDSSDAVDGVHPCWLHLDYSLRASADWLRSTPAIPDGVRAALTGESLRPRVSRLEEGLMVTLRSVNHNSGTRPDQLVPVRIFINKKLVVTTRRRKVFAIDEVRKELQNGNGPVDAGSWLVNFCDALTDHTSDFIEQLHDRIVVLEDGLLEQRIPARGELALLRKQIVVLRHYMAPQRDVFSRLSSERIIWINDEMRARMQEISDRLGRGLDELDAGIVRTGILADEISSVRGESMNRRSYTMSLMAMIFLPSTFLTGLFGVNLGGIPGNSYHYGFSIFCFLLFLLIFAVIWWLKYRHWL